MYKNENNIKNNKIIDKKMIGDKSINEKYQGPRDESFKNMLRLVFQKSKLNMKTINKIIIDPLFNQAFTHKSFDNENNYEILELLGDASLTKNIVWYIFDRFPDLHCPEGVKVLSRLKINFVSKQTYSSIADKLNFWDFISADTLTRSTMKKTLLEDVFESFFAVTELVLDKLERRGIGIEFSRQIISSLFDDIDIPIDYYSLYDSKTILKENIDFLISNIKANSNQTSPYIFNLQISSILHNKTNSKFHNIVSIGNLEYESNRIKNGELELTKTIVSVNLIINNDGQKYQHKYILGESTGNNKAQAEQAVSLIVLKTLQKRNITKPISDFYINLEKNYKK